MTSPPRRVDFDCPRCNRRSHDYLRASINLDLDGFDDEYIDLAMSVRCSHCGMRPDKPTVADGRVAVLSRSRRYRYALWRTWDLHRPTVLFIGLNPSIADDKRDDPTLRRCIDFARSWSYGGVAIVNLFARIATDPSEMLRSKDPVGPFNDFWLYKLGEDLPIAVAAWGNAGIHMGRDQAVRKIIPSLHVLRQNKSGQPAHPLYLPRGLLPFRSLD